MQIFLNPGAMVLGVAMGILGLLLVLSLIVSYAYSETTLRVFAVYLLLMVAGTLIGQNLNLPDELSQNMLLIAGSALLSAFQAHLLKSRHPSGVVRGTFIAVVLASIGLMILYAVPVNALISDVATAAWAALLLAYQVYLLVQSRDTAGPWKWWLAVGATLGWLSAAIFLSSIGDAVQVYWPVVFMLLCQMPPIYLSLVWRSRLLNESRLRSISSNVTDPLTGLATTMVLVERLMRVMSRAHQNPSASTLFLIEVQNFQGLLNELGNDFNEKLMLEAAMRLRRSIGDNDLAARLAGGRFAVMAQGLESDEEINSLATRLVVSGLRIDSPLLEGVEFKFRIIVSELKINRPKTVVETHEWLAVITGYFKRWPGSHRARQILFVAANDLSDPMPARGGHA